MPKSRWTPFGKPLSPRLQRTRSIEAWALALLRSRCGWRHIRSEADVFPNGVHLLFGIATQHLSQRTLTFVEVDRHLGLWIDTERVAHPSSVVCREQTLVRIGQIDTLAF